jgi:hypothetical protein
MGAPNAAYSSLLSKYSTVSGFDQFSSGLQAQLVGYIMTQTLVSDQAELAKATDPAVVATNPAMQSMGMEINTMINQHLAADTHLAPSAKQSLASDLAVVMRQTAAPAPTDASTSSDAVAPPDTTSGSPEPTGTNGANSEASGAPSDTLGVSKSGAGDDVPSPTEEASSSGSDVAVPTQAAPTHSSNAPSSSDANSPSVSPSATDSPTPTDNGATSSSSVANLPQQTTNEANRLGMLSLSGVAAGMVAALAIAL